LRGDAGVNTSPIWSVCAVSPMCPVCSSRAFDFWALVPNYRGREAP